MIDHEARCFIDVWDRPGLGVTFNVQAAKARLADEDRHFFDWRVIHSEWRFAAPS
jgi:hypothetical protein